MFIEGPVIRIGPNEVGSTWQPMRHLFFITGIASLQRLQGLSRDLFRRIQIHQGSNFLQLFQCQ
jgi:hypothetical protein